MTRNRYAWLALALAALVLGSCARREIRGQETTGLDRKLSTYAWIEEGDLVTFVVGTRAARDRDGSGYVPVEIAIANTGLKNLVVTRESFTLVDEDGNRYPAATPQELLAGYEYLDIDRDALGELRGILTTKFATYSGYPSRFSPTRGVASRFASTVVRDRVVLPRFGYLIDYVYFPEPATGIRDHRFELFLDSQSLPDPVFVKFAVE